MNDFEKDLRERLKKDHLNYDTDKNFKSIIQKLDRNKDVPKINPNQRKFQLNSWLIAAAMSAVILGFGIERQMSNYSSFPESIHSQDSILDSSHVNLDSILLNWK